MWVDTATTRGDEALIYNMMHQRRYGVRYRRVKNRQEKVMKYAVSYDEV
ncbi:hypothetical protein Pcaca03_02870 [Pectobacterium carotovorum subsp. carotovorum]|uniref:Uncharacterized protein n=1 Tax=Pectobacterium carotovorum subsp. carotovorum TaxID=555 RepID=A0AAI9KXC1_PECCC|nr:hypothetical protein SOASR016_02870 [Pectobacterium carotovorum subsp. carotovorum]GLV67843.1 hypothetical protein Pcaca03_02870 [Pectobacterium carotovorum subsp. carotovorum]